MDSARIVPAGRLRRLREELIDEGTGVVESSPDPDAVIEELDYALHPPRHERRLPTYGSIVLPTMPVDRVGREHRARHRPAHDTARRRRQRPSLRRRTRELDRPRTRRHHRHRRVRPVGRIRARHRRRQRGHAARCWSSVARTTVFASSDRSASPAGTAPGGTSSRRCGRGSNARPAGCPTRRARSSIDCCASPCTISARPVSARCSCSADVTTASSSNGCRHHRHCGSTDRPPSARSATC